MQNVATHGQVCGMSTTTDDTEHTHKFTKIHVQPRTYGDPQEVNMPKGCEVLDAVFYEGRVTIWVKAELEAEEETRKIHVIQDDQPFDAAKFSRIGMALRPSGAALHIVEVIA